LTLPQQPVFFDYWDSIRAALGTGTGGPGEKSFFPIRGHHPMAICRFQAAWYAIFSLKSD
jgi:hypothetical protein